MRLLLFCFAVVWCTPTDFIRYPHLDVPSKYDILRSDASIEKLKELCRIDKQCQGFTSTGILKSNVDHYFFVNSTVDLYMKLDQPMDSPNPNIWPMPAQFTNGNINVTLNPSTFQFIASPSFSDLTNAFTWFQTLIFPHPVTSIPPSAVILPSLTVNVANTNVPLQHGVDESYTLIVPSDGSGAKLSANTFWGALAGLQTFSQMVYFDFDSHSYQIRYSPWQITDAPHYAFRGVLIDTSRHFQPIPILLKLVDSLSFAKFNVLHWHMSDTQSFPFDSRTYPKLWTGSYSLIERYTQEDVAEVVAYARQRGIRVMVEFDTPGHAGSWCTGYMDVCPSPTCLQPLNPAVEDTFTLINSLFSELTGNRQGAGLFPENFLHLGGDEVDTSCWTSTASIANWMKAQGYSADDAYFYFVNRTFQIALNQSRTPVNWEEVYNHFKTSLNKAAVVHAWANKSTVAKAVADGYKALNSDGWYLDHLNDTWQSYYTNDPRADISDATQQALVLGGECCMWGETVDPSDIFNTIWPRAAAVAERLWSPSTVTDTKLALGRYEWFRCFLTRRGIGAAPSTNSQARQPPNGPGGCYVQ